ncbi:protease [Lithospermum erythrorhizon]|uniref:Protease n=1 Tax=Lithospermum erythrorhizon TaxID=34254 RepID=A0AAV3NIF4_LITER
MNMEVIELDTDFGSTFSGVLADEQGRFKQYGEASQPRFLFFNLTCYLHNQEMLSNMSNHVQLKCGGSSSKNHQFVRRLPINTVSQILDKIVSGADGLPLLINGIKRSMPISVMSGSRTRVILASYIIFGVDCSILFRMEKLYAKARLRKDPVRRQVLRVKGCLAGSKAENLLEHNDMILAINKEPVTCFRGIEDACQELDKSGDIDGKLHATILRQGHEIELYVGTDVRDGVVRVKRYSLCALQWIVEVNGKPTPDLDTFVSVIKEIEHGEFVRIRTVFLNGKPPVSTLKQDLHYFPTWELRFNPQTAEWRRNIIEGLDCN